MKLLSVTGRQFNSLLQLVVKAWNGRSSTFTAEEISPYGIDSNPIDGMVAVYARTEADGDEVFIGYINKNRLADIGEVRLFSTDSSGTLKAYVWLKNNGTLELLGNTDNAVRYSKLELAFNQLKSDFNALVTAYNSHVHVIVNAVPLATPPGVVTSTATVTTGTPSSADITPAKINEIKTL